MTPQEAREIMNKVTFYWELGEQTLTQKQINEALDMAIKALGQISHLKDRPCEACEFYTEEGCSKWECVFEGSDAE